MTKNNDYLKGYVDCHSGYSRQITDCCEKEENASETLSRIIQYLHVESAVVGKMAELIHTPQSKWKTLIAKLKRN